MIKIKRKDTDKARQAVVDLEKAKQSGSTYNTENVNQALREVFYRKCYICEYKQATSYQIGIIYFWYVRIAIILN